jgi:hypothetical protein
MLNRRRTFGVEIEMGSSHPRYDRWAGDGLVSDLLEFMASNGVNVYDAEDFDNYGGYTHDHTDRWKLVTDSSCGWEFVSPILNGEHGLAEVEEVARLLSAFGMKVNRSCGLHVHHDVSTLSAEQLKNMRMLYSGHMFQISRLFPMSRRIGGYQEMFDYMQDKNSVYGNSWDFVGQRATLDGNQYAPYRPSSRFRGNERIYDWYKSCMSGNVRAFAAATVQDFMGHSLASGMGRNVPINFGAFRRQGTAEFRQHQGTLVGRKITDWVRVSQSFVEGGVARRFEPIVQTHSSSDSSEKALLKALGLADAKARSGSAGLQATYEAMNRMIRRAKGQGYYDDTNNLPPRYFVSMDDQWKTLAVFQSWSAGSANKAVSSEIPSFGIDGGRPNRHLDWNGDYDRWISSLHPNEASRISEPQLAEVV